MGIGKGVPAWEAYGPKSSLNFLMYYSLNMHFTFTPLSCYSIV